ncbi:MAG: hypothetical protein D3904_17325, partial [Candidatus Electrothrix sp. EH2]|nr:hypothetical protein [Candidatus Electrothrix sp. EH2]
MKTSRDRQEQQSPASANRQHESGGIDTMFSQTLSELIVEKKNRQADILLDQLTSWLHTDKPQVKTGAVSHLTETLELLIAHREWQRMEKLLPAVSQALAIASADDDTVWQIITALSIFAAYQVEIGRYAPARKALLIFGAPDALKNANTEIREQAEQLI